MQVAYGKRVEHVGTQVSNDPWIFIKFSLKPGTRTINDAGFNLVSGTPSLAETGKDVGGHEDLAVVGLPPTPPPIFVLVVVKAIEAGSNLLVQIRRADVGLNAEILGSFGHDNVG